MLIKRRLLRSSAIFATSTTGFLATDHAIAEVIPFTVTGGSQQYFRSANARLDLNGDSTSDFAVVDQNSGIGSFYLSDYFGELGVSGSNRVLNDGYFGAAVLASGEIVGTDTTGWLTEASLDNFIGTRGYVGLVFDIPGGSPHFGYLDLEMDAARQVVTIYGGAYESIANTPITIGVPEPQSLALLASGAAGLAAWRRKKAS